MGFGFSLLFVFVLLPVTGVLLLAWLITRKKSMAGILAIIWLSVIVLVAFATLIREVTAKRILVKEDFFGSYVVDRKFFPGKQADWQYDHFRFVIKKNDSIYFYVTEGAQIRATYPGIITTTSAYPSARLVLHMAQPAHHIVASDPTVFRSTSNFYLVFHSERFNNVFFKKGDWHPRE